MLKIRTNRQFRPLLSGFELTESERKELDYIADSSDLEKWSEQYNRFFRYRGNVYDTNEFVRIVKRSEYRGGFSHCVDEDSQLLNWDCIQTDSFFSGIVIKYDSCDYDSVMVGLALALS